nr:zinc finger BED domain-containing protein RICESLEEPER 2-like [Ipomoea batatas]
MWTGSCLVLCPSLRGWRSSHLKARQLSEIRSGGFGRGVVEGALVAASDHVGQSVRVGSTGHEADGARVRDSSGEGTVVKFNNQASTGCEQLSIDVGDRIYTHSFHFRK